MKAVWMFNGLFWTALDDLVCRRLKMWTRRRTSLVVIANSSLSLSPAPSRASKIGLRLLTRSLRSVHWARYVIENVVSVRRQTRWKTWDLNMRYLDVMHLINQRPI
jgi:hypothetical protein